MHRPTHLTLTTSFVRHSISRSPLQRGFLLVALALALAWLTLLPTARAVKPPPDGDYPGGNTAEGEDALFSLTTGRDNTAIGFHALFRNTTGSQNTANGVNALSSNRKGSFNTATGFQALFTNTNGGNNTAAGFQALYSNTTGRGNTANGLDALFSNTIGNDNTAGGIFALFSNTNGVANTASGFIALGNNLTGSNNTAQGNFALFNNTSGSSNIALGDSAGFALTTGNNNIDIGNAGVAGESAKIRIGTKGTHKNTFIAGISGVTVAGGVGVIIDAQGHLGTATSSARFKEAIKPMDKASEAILKLQPVTFRYKHELDPDGIPQFGLVAEQVEKVNPDLVARDEDGKVSTVRYEAVNAMLLNEFLKQHRKVEEQSRKEQEQEATISELKSTVARQQKDFVSAVAQQQKEVEALTATVQKVSEQIELGKPAPQVAADNQ